MSFKWPRVEGVVESLTKTNALYPLLIGLFFSVLIIVAVFSFSENVLLQVFSMFISSSFVFQILRSYQYFSTRNPDMLRTETHVLHKKVLEMIGDDQHPLSEIATKAIISTVNPANPLTNTDIIKINESNLPLTQEKKDYE